MKKKHCRERNAFCIMSVVLDKDDITKTYGIKGEKMKFLKDNLPKGKAAWLFLFVSLVICILTALGIWATYHYFENPGLFRDFVDEHYVEGVLIMLFMFMIQVVLALIPGGLLEVACGYAFGPVAGSIIAVTGIMAGSGLTILLVRKFGRKFAEMFYPKEKLESLPFLQNKRKRNALVFFIFLLPGTPKDLLTYVVGLTDMSILSYLLLTGISRTPAIILSTMGGDALGLEKYGYGIVFLAALTVVSIIGVFIYKKIHKKTK